MSGHIVLLGAEDVQRAASNMCEAAAQISRAASNMQDTMYRHQVFMQEWLAGLESILAKHGIGGGE